LFEIAGLFSVSESVVHDAEKVVRYRCHRDRGFHCAVEPASGGFGKRTTGQAHAAPTTTNLLPELVALV
jgi:hypothetical protein